MARTVFEIQGYAVMLNKVCFVTRVFKAESEEGYQFNIRFSEKLLLTIKYPVRHEAELQRGLLVKALKEA